MKLIPLWLIGLLFMAPHPSVLLWFWLFAPLLLVPVWLLHRLFSIR